MIALTARKLTRIIFLYNCGVCDQEIVDDINGTQDSDEEARSDPDYYVQCVLKQEDYDLKGNILK